jgi:hypothetical protein
MIHIALNHTRTADWMRTQVSYIRRFVAGPVRLVACVEDIAPSEIADVDDVVAGTGGNHVGKLNLLGHRILEDAEGDDLIVFLNATTLPIADDWLVPAHESVAMTSISDPQFYPDAQPHPIFCSTTVNVWRELPGDWAAGFESMPGRNPSTMAGANLADRLRHANLEWATHSASAADTTNPLSFGCFGSGLFHHGSLARRLVAAGFEEQAARSMAKDIATRILSGRDLVTAADAGIARQR